MIDPQDVMNINSLLVKIVTQYQQVIREMNTLIESIYVTIDDEEIKAAITKVMAETNAKLQEVDFAINTIRAEFEVKPIIH